jgi:hypothetical protein
VDQQAQPVLQAQQVLRDGLVQRAQLGQMVQLAQLDLKGGLVQRAQLDQMVQRAQLDQMESMEVQVVLYYNHHIQKVMFQR